jgi:peptidyl-prolyl cis-trans isomerase SurA
MMVFSRFYLFLFVLICAPYMACAQNSAGIAAIINDNIITMSDVKARVSLVLQGARAEPPPNVRKELEQQALQTLIEEQIRMTEVKRLNIDVTDQDIDEGIAKLAAQNNIPPDEFKEILQQKPDVYRSLRDQIRTQAGWGKLVRQKLRPQIIVSDADIDTYLNEQKKQIGKMEYEVAEILLPYEAANEKQIFNLAQQILGELHSRKQRFSTLAKQFSQGAEASKGGLLGWVKAGQLEKSLDDALPKLALGDATNPIKAGGAYHILYLKDKREVMSLQQSSRKLQIKQLFSPAPPQAPDNYVQASFARVKEWQTQATDCMAMQRLITANPSPMSRDLGMVALSDLPPPVAAIVKDAPTGKVLEPVHAADGFLLMMVCGRDDTVNEEAVRDAAANILGSERLNRLQKRYFRDLKDAAYVDNKLISKAK